MKNILYRQPAAVLKCVLLIMAIAIVPASCDDFVDVPQPSSQLIGETVFENKTTATAALKDIYAQLRDYGMLSGKPGGLSLLLGTYTDELTSYETGISGSEPFYNNALTPSLRPLQEIWTRAYGQVYAANAVIEGVTNSEGITAADKDLLIGEALFLRAYIHSYLAGLFGACPYITVTDYKQNLSPAKHPVTEIYSLCIDDLEAATQKLSTDYITPERVRPNAFAAQALLARLYLYNGQWEEASNAASAVINESGLYVWEPDLDKIFLKESTTTIWQLASGGGYANTQEGAIFIFNAVPPTFVALRPELYNAFEEGDQRPQHWIKEITDGASVWYHPYKYKQDNSVSTTTEYSIMLRLAEQHLIRSEARAMQGDLIGAKEDLNKVRNTAGLGDTNAITAAEIKAAIAQDRRFEFFTETGMRFFDLQRTGTLDAALIPLKPGWNTTDRLWPLPQSELLVSPSLLPQNPGY